ncbi:4'-phosphopantetheinyl transferase family protein [Herbidospora cretacea]|uniref:4'-phosphopantetheinyl transferase family protein n=1 Tax=Herbidospora cretacea TaxID=28444 RepID=UPI000689659A|nr:4'-phosphopantetheinyl transferase superfamily protein [Herbidospora cretacea]
MTDSLVWRVHLDQPDGARWAPLLSGPERARAAALATPVERRRYTVAHAALRAVLGGLTGLPPAGLVFGAEDNGRPYLAGRPIDFNLSHSEEWALIGVAPPGLRIGVDVERVRDDLDHLAMARHLYRPAEVDHLTRAASPREEYFRLWCAKEAYIKATGAGLAGLRDAVVTHEGNATVGSSRSLRWLDVAPGYAGAVVTTAVTTTVTTAGRPAPRTG